jgi:hypothetical protein
MGESTKIVVEHYPVDKLPEDLRKGLESGELVRITVERERELDRSDRPLTSFIGAGKGAYASPEEAVAAIRALRDEWP